MPNASTLNSGLNRDVVQKNSLDEVFMAEYERMPGPNMATAEDNLIFNQSTASSAAHVAEVFGGVTAWKSRFDDEEAMDAEAARVADKITYSMEEFSKELSISKRFFDDDQYDTVSKALVDFANKARVAREKNAFGLFRNAFTTSLTADGKPIVADDHVTISGDVVDNKLTEALSETSLEDAIVKLAEQKDQSGEITGHEARVLLVPPKLFAEAVRLTESTLRPGSSDNDLNVFSVKYGIYVKQSIYLGAAARGSDTAWFLLGANHSIYRWVRQGIETKLVSWEYSKNNSYIYKGMFREQVGAITYEGIVGSTGVE